MGGKVGGVGRRLTLTAPVISLMTTITGTDRKKAANLLIRLFPRLAGVLVLVCIVAVRALLSDS